jgi:tRNA(adenine34) deaminase
MCDDRDPDDPRWPVAQLTHKVWMDRALAQARLAVDHDDVPVGAVVVRGGEVVAEARNRREVDADPTAHAEILALRAAARALGSWRLDGCTLYVTLEPCSMCAGALVLARLPALVFGATDPKAGAVGSLYDIAREPRLNHQVHVESGILAEDCGQILKRFFAARRSPSYRARAGGPGGAQAEAAASPGGA